MLEAGVFENYGVNISLMGHAAPADSPYFISYALDEYFVEFHGKEAHASASPYEGVNAQDALVLAYDAVAMLRQQSLSTDQFHGIITSGGKSPNVIPALATANFLVRSKDKKDLKKWSERILNCFKAGALATGAEVNITLGDGGYDNMVTNEFLAQSYSKWFTGLGGKLAPAEIDKLRGPAASTDQGDISHAVPAMQSLFGITHEDGSAPKTGPHTPDFEVAAGSKRAFEQSLRAGKALAGAAIDVLTVDGLLEKIQKEFEEAKKDF